MKDLFNIRRFGAYAWMWYRENMKKNLLFWGVMTLITYLALCDFNPFRVETTFLWKEGDLAGFMAKYRLKYATAFGQWLCIITFLVALYSARDLVKTSFTLLLPVSRLEKFLFVLLNALIVVSIVFTLIFYGVASVTASYKYVALEVEALGEVPAAGESVNGKLKAGHPKIYTEVGNIWAGGSYPSITVKGEDKAMKVLNDISGHPVLLSVLGEGIALYIIAVGMWGGVTFRRYPFWATIGIHGILLIAIGVITIFTFIIDQASSSGQPSASLAFYGGEEEIVLPSPYWLLLGYLYPLAYFIVTWKKLKTKQY